MQVMAIEIDPHELQSIGEVLVESYFHHNLIQRTRSLQNTFRIQIQKLSFSLLQLIGITCSLVGANTITAIMQQKLTILCHGVMHHPIQNCVNIIIVCIRMIVRAVGSV